MYSWLSEWCGEWSIVKMVLSMLYR